MRPYCLLFDEMPCLWKWHIMETTFSNVNFCVSVSHCVSSLCEAVWKRLSPPFPLSLCFPLCFLHVSLCSCLSILLSFIIPLFSVSLPHRPEPHGRGGGSLPGQADSPLPEQDEEILGSDDDEQEDPNDYCRGKPSVFLALSSDMWHVYPWHYNIVSALTYLLLNCFLF